MKALTVLLLATFSVPQVSIPAQRQDPQPHFAEQASVAPRKGGVWYFARSGHAVYCYGPVMRVPNSAGGIDKVATFCRGERLLVPLKD